MFLVRRVVGDSMFPTLVPGRIIVALRTRKVCVGDVVVLRHDNLEKIKRVARLETGRVFLLGDNPGESTDSREFGWLDSSAIRAKVIWPRVWQAS